MSSMHEWTQEIKFDLVRTPWLTAVRTNMKPGSRLGRVCLGCTRADASLAAACHGSQPQLLLLLGTKQQCLSLQDKHRRQFSPADKISEQPAGAIGARVSLRKPLVPGGS